jgi:protease-4
VLRGLDVLRRLVLNLLFFGLPVALAVAVWSGRPKVPDGAALVLKPEGTIVEELAEVSPLDQLAARRAGVGSVTTGRSRPSSSTSTRWAARA